MTKINVKQNKANWQKQQFHSKIATGLFAILFGVLLLLKQMDVILPEWLISWQTILIAIGVVTLIRHNFRSVTGYIFVGVGLVFIIKEFHPEWINTKLVLPLIVIIVGCTILYKAYQKYNRKDTGNAKKVHNQMADDTFESNAIFGGVEKIIVSKNLQRADINSVFGSNEVNFMQADFDGKAIVEANAVFGGITLIIPSTWKVQSQLSTFAGSIEDKRPTIAQDESKVLHLKGSCVFGGIEIRTS